MSLRLRLIIVCRAPWVQERAARQAAAGDANKRPRV